MGSSPYKLCMKGTIRTLEKCPVCTGKFSAPRLVCPSCLTTPKRVFISIYVAGYGKVRLFSDRQGRPLSSYDLADRVLTGIRYEIDQYIFDPTKYVKADVKRYLFETQIENFLADKDKEVEKGNRANSYVRLLKCYNTHYYEPYFKAQDVREINTAKVKAFYNQLPKKSLKYIKNIMDALEHFFNTLVQDEVIERSPIFPEVKIDEKPPVWVDYYTQLKIIKTIPKKDRPIFLFLAWQGVRPGEARALKVKDIDFKVGGVLIARTRSDNELKERTKGKHSKWRAINPMLLGLLKRQCAGKLPEAFVFTNTRTGDGYSESAFKRVWAPLKKHFPITPYQTTRHSFASHLVKTGVHLNTIKDILGHTDIRTTLKYAHGDLENQRLAFEKKLPAKVIPLGQSRGSKGVAGENKP